MKSTNNLTHKKLNNPGSHYGPVVSNSKTNGKDQMKMKVPGSEAMKGINPVLPRGYKGSVFVPSNHDGDPGTRPTSD